MIEKVIRQGVRPAARIQMRKGGNMFGKKEKAENRKREHYSDKIVKYRLRKFYQGSLIVAAIAAVAAIFWISQRNRVYTEFTVVESSERNVSANAKTISLGDHILTYSNDGAGCFDKKGKTIWNETFEMQDPIVATCNTAIAFGDYNGRKIYVMNTQNILGEISTNMPIRDLAVAENGVVAAVLDDSDITWIYLYNSKGEAAVRFKTTMSQFGYPIDVSLSPDSNLAMVSFVAAEEGGVKSSVAFYNFGEVGQNEVDNYMSGYDYQAVVPYVRFMTPELAFAVADDRLMFYEGAQKPVSKTEVLLESEVRSVHHSETYVALVSYDTTGKNKYVINLYDSMGKVCLSQGFDLEYRNVVLKDERVYIYGETGCSIYNLSGVEKFNGVMDESISLLIPGDSIGKFTLVGRDSIREIELK